MPSHPDVHLGVQSPRDNRLVRLEQVPAEAGEDSIVVKIVPCDSNGRTRPDDHPSPELVRLTCAKDKRAFEAVTSTTQVCWLRCHHREQQA